MRCEKMLNQKISFHGLRNKLCTVTMQFNYFDAHSHIQGSEYDIDRDKLLSELARENIGTIAVGVDKASSESAVLLSHKYDNVFASVGVHPTEDETFDTSAMSVLAEDSRTVAIGECGLDYFRTENVSTARAKQVPLFEAHIALSVASHKPLMIHARPLKSTMNAYNEIIDILKSAKREHGDALTGNIHFFVGGVEEARAFFDMDFTVSYTAVVTFAREYDEAIRYAPLDRLLAETDSPYVSPPPNRGSRNTPHSVKAVVATLAQIRGEKEETVRKATVENAMRVFAIK